MKIVAKYLCLNVEIYSSVSVIASSLCRRSMEVICQKRKEAREGDSRVSVARLVISRITS